MIIHLARVAPLLAALACWRVSRPAALALLVAFAASLVYLSAPWEPLRWVSAIVGLVGAIEFGMCVQEMRRHPLYVWVLTDGGGPMKRRAHSEEELARMPRRAWIGLLLLGSMAGDFAAMVAWKAVGEWVMPVAQIVVCAAIALLALWPERKP